MSLETFIELVKILLPPCPACNYHMKYCRCPIPDHWMAL